MRAYWQETRYYYLVRNAIYVDYKYFRSSGRVAAQALGYLVKGAHNRLTSQAADGLSLDIVGDDAAPAVHDDVRRVAPAGSIAIGNAAYEPDVIRLIWGLYDVAMFELQGVTCAESPGAMKPSAARIPRKA